MAHDQLQEEGQVAGRGRGGARLVVAGVVGACALGVGLGLWARPSAAERGDAPSAPKPEVESDTARRMLQIVLDEAPAPIGPLLDVMPASPGGAPPPELPSPAGLMKVDAPLAAPAALPVVIPAAVPEPRPEPKPEPRPERRPQAAPAKPEKAKAAQAAPAKASETKVAKSGIAKAPEKTVRPARKENGGTKLAKAEAKTKSKPKAERKKLAKLVKAVKTAPKKIKDKAVAAERKTKREIQVAEAKLAKVKADKARKAKAPAAKPSVEKAAAPKKKVAPRGEGPVRVARSEACASSDPGEALVCADPRLNQRDRQLQRAFRDAQAAGVPASALQRQQERWRQARAAAARDGSWAVEDVYEARIAELNGLARDARDY